MSMSDTGITTPTKVSMQFCFIKLLLHLEPSKTKYASQKISTITKITNKKAKNN